MSECLKIQELSYFINQQRSSVNKLVGIARDIALKNISKSERQLSKLKEICGTQQVTLNVELRKQASEAQYQASMANVKKVTLVVFIMLLVGGLLAAKQFLP